MRRKCKRRYITVSSMIYVAWIKIFSVERLAKITMLVPRLKGERRTKARESTSMIKLKSFQILSSIHGVPTTLHDFSWHTAQQHACGQEPPYRQAVHWDHPVRHWGESLRLLR